ncbi:SRPBCC domain-containing protein [Pendulispora albinea]|uniref:SRPBCC domain-containing protein n=1 Tax=Pendulispora albinea TaxID=2741071 RepID=A0ABZ2LZ50_9BACT
MSTWNKGAARAVADVTKGIVLASVEIEASPERVFYALTQEEDITRWWGSDDQYRMIGYQADLRAGGAWRVEGRMPEGRTFVTDGEILEIEPARKLVQTWNLRWNRVSTVAYLLEPTDGGTRLTVRHEGFGEDVPLCRMHETDWETALGWLVRYLTSVSACVAP